MSANLKNVPLPYCPLCKGGMEFLFETNDYRRPQLSEKYSVGWCARCKYGKLAGDFRPGDVSQFYEIEYYTHGANNTSETSAGLLGRIRTHVAWRFDKGSDFSPEEVGVPGRLIDIGCGGGNNMAKLRAAGFSVVGVEPDPSARSVAATFGPVYSGTAETPPIEVGCEYDYALLSHVLEHTISAATALERVHQLLAKSGKLIVEVPNCGAAGFKEFGPIWPWTDVPRHIHFFTQNSLMKTLEAAGFSIVKVLYTGFTRQFSSSWIADLHKIHHATPGSGYSKSWLAKQSWGLLLRTAIASAHYKYDSIRIHALKV
jgi:SAM-dependent methyltransferase